MKMLLVGELNDTLNSLNECMKDYFQIQMCSENAKNVTDMVRLLRPNIIVFNILEINTEVRAIFSALHTKLDEMPIITIVTEQSKEEMTNLLEGFKNHNILCRPINTKTVLKSCYQLLHLDLSELSPAKKPAPIVKKKILVIDDSALVLRNLKTFFDDRYEVFLATSGKKGLETILTKKPDLILLDYDMPGMNGREVFERIKETEEIKDIPVIFLTSISEKDSVLAVLQHTPYGYILKPPAKDKILKIVKEALDK